MVTHAGWVRQRPWCPMQWLSSYVVTAGRDLWESDVFLIAMVMVTLYIGWLFVCALD